METITRMKSVPANDEFYVRPPLSSLDEAWADIYWTFQENAFDLSSNHIGQTTCPVPFSNKKYFETYAEVPF